MSSRAMNGLQGKGNSLGLSLGYLYYHFTSVYVQSAQPVVKKSSLHLIG